MKDLYFRFTSFSFTFLFILFVSHQIQGQGFDKLLQIGTSGQFIGEANNELKIATCENSRIYQLSLDQDGNIMKQDSAFEGSCGSLWTSDNHIIQTREIDSPYIPRPQINVIKRTPEGRTIWLLAIEGVLPYKEQPIIEQSDHSLLVLSSRPHAVDSLWEIVLTKIGPNGLIQWSQAMPTIWGSAQGFTEDGFPIPSLINKPIVNTFKCTPDGGFIYNNEAIFEVDFPTQKGNTNLLVKGNANAAIEWIQSFGIPSATPSYCFINDIEFGPINQTFLTGTLQKRNSSELQQTIFAKAIDANGVSYLEHELDLSRENKPHLEAQGITIVPTFDAGMVIAGKRNDHTDSLYLYKIIGDENASNYNEIAWETFIPFVTPSDLIEKENNEIAITGSKNQKTWVKTIGPDGPLSPKDTADLVLNAYLSTTSASPIQYVLTLVNEGPDVANGVAIQSNFSQPVNWIEMEAGYGTLSLEGKTTTWEVPSIFPGEQWTMTITLRSKDDLPFQVFSEIVDAQASDPDSTPGNGNQEFAKEDDETFVEWTGPECGEINVDLKAEIIRILGYQENENSRILTAYVLTDNIWGGRIGQSVTNHFYLSKDTLFDPFADVFIGQSTIEQPLGHRFDTVQFQLPLVEKGMYYLMMINDPEDEILEVSEANNIDFLEVLIDYCEPKSAFPWHEWISEVSFNDQSYDSGQAHYTDFTHKTFDLNIGKREEITLEVSFSYTTYDEYVTVWIDLDQDDQFEPQELVMTGILDAPPSGTPMAYMNEFTNIPSTALPGRTTMRIILSREGFADSPCSDIAYGEIEDYSVNLQFNTSYQALLDIHPNPTAAFARVNTTPYQGQTIYLSVINQQGYHVLQEKWENINQEAITIPTQQWIDGSYIVRLSTKEAPPQTAILNIQKD